MKRFLSGLFKATFSVVFGLVPAAILCLIARPLLVQATRPTWLDALIWVTALAGVCIVLGIVDSVDNRKGVQK